MRISERATRPVVRAERRVRRRSWTNVYVGLLDRTPSERSEDKLVFLINDQPVELFLTSTCSQRALFRRTIDRSAAERDGH